MGAIFDHRRTCRNEDQTYLGCKLPEAGCQLAVRRAKHFVIHNDQVGAMAVNLANGSGSAGSHRDSVSKTSENQLIHSENTGIVVDTEKPWLVCWEVTHIAPFSTDRFAGNREASTRWFEGILSNLKPGLTRN